MYRQAAEVSRQMYRHAAEISKQMSRQAAEISRQMYRQAAEISKQMYRQTAEISRHMYFVQTSRRYKHTTETNCQTDSRDSKTRLQYKYNRNNRRGVQYTEQTETEISKLAYRQVYTVQTGI